MTAFQNGSFELVGLSAGKAAGWAWTSHATAAATAAFNGGTAGHEGFELGWGADEFVDELDDVGMLRATFNLPGYTDAAEGFERKWAGNETARFDLVGGVSATFAHAAPEAFDSFEYAWGGNDAFIRTLGPSAAAPFASSGNVDSFETHWKGNEAFLTDFDPGELDPALFGPTASSFESFENVVPDRPVSFDPATDKVLATAHGFANGAVVAFVNPTGGTLPSGLIDAVTYFVVSATTNTFQVSQTLGGSAVAFDGFGTGVNYAKADRSLHWTETDVL